MDTIFIYIVEPLIFSNSSYFIFVNCDPANHIRFRLACDSIKIRPLFCGDPNDLKKTLTLAKRVNGILAFADNYTDEIKKQILDETNQRKIPVTFATTKDTRMPNEIPFVETANEEEITKVLLAFLAKLTPIGLGKLILQSTNIIFPTFFPSVRDFQIVPTPRAKLDRQIIFNLVAGDLIGYVATKADSAALKTLLAPDKKETYHLILQEAVNQTLGLIVHEIKSKGVNAKVGFPTQFDLKSIPEITPMIYFPSVTVGDTTQSVYFSLGFYDLKGAPLFDLGDLRGPSDMGDVDFL